MPGKVLIALDQGTTSSRAVVFDTEGRMLAVCAAWAVLLRLMHGIFLLVLLYGLTIPGYLCVKIYDPIFKTMEPNEESEAE